MISLHQSTNFLITPRIPCLAVPSAAIQFDIESLYSCLYTYIPVCSGLNAVCLQLWQVTASTASPYTGCVSLIWVWAMSPSSTTFSSKPWRSSARSSKVRNAPTRMTSSYTGRDWPKNTYVGILNAKKKNLVVYMTWWTRIRIFFTTLH